MIKIKLDIVDGAVNILMKMRDPWDENRRKYFPMFSLPAVWISKIADRFKTFNPIRRRTRRDQELALARGLNQLSTKSFSGLKDTISEVNP